MDRFPTQRLVNDLSSGGIYEDKIRCGFLYRFVILINLITYAMLSLVSANYYPHRKMGTSKKMSDVLMGGDLTGEDPRCDFDCL